MTFVLGPDVSGLWVIVGALVLAASTGLRVFVAPFVLVFIGALDGLQGPETPMFAALAALLALAEMALDKVRGMDESLDAAGLVLKPIWAVAVVAWQVPLEDTLWLGAIAAALSLGVSLGKARLRLQARSPARAKALSLVEDFGATVLVVSALYAPFAAAAGLVAFTVLEHTGAHRLGRTHWDSAA